MKQILVVCSKTFNEEEKSTLSIVQKAVEERKVKTVLCDRSALSNTHFLDCELVIAVGGDGTFLRASHFIKNNIPLLGVNSDVEGKEGFYMKCSKYDFKSKFSLVQKGRFNIKKLLRLEASINKKQVNELALNEFYFGSDKPYMTSRYSLEIEGVRERQRSSGVLAATPTGSNAWAKSGKGQQLKQDFKGFAYAVREPYERNIFKDYKLKSGILEHNSEFKIKSEMDKAVLVADSISPEYAIGYGDVIAFRISDKFLNTLEFSD